MKQLPNIKDIINKWALDDGDLLHGAAMEAMKEYGRKVRDYTLDIAAEKSNLDLVDLDKAAENLIKLPDSILKLKEDKRLQI